MKKDKVTPKEYFGCGSIINLATILEDINPTSILLVTGRNSYLLSGASEKVDHYLSSYNVVHFKDFESNPKLDDVVRGVALFFEHKCDLVLAVGGGSALDIAKSISVLGSQHEKNLKEEDIKGYITGEKRLKPEKERHFYHGSSKTFEAGCPIIAIPTTAGTGSEATHFSVVYIKKNKYSFAHRTMLPDYVILDPELTYSTPREIVASCGLDALSQAIESYWSTNSTDESKHYSMEAMKLIAANLVNSLSASNHDAKAQMLLAANLAGKGINIAKTTAAHALSYAFTSYFGIPHGHAVALTLGEMLPFNYQVEPSDLNDMRGVAYVKQAVEDICNVFQVSSVEDFPLFWRNLVQQLGLTVYIKPAGVSREQLKIIEDNYNVERGKNNPRRLDASALRTLLEKCYGAD